MFDLYNNTYILWVQCGGWADVCIGKLHISYRLAFVTVLNEQC